MYTTSPKWPAFSAVLITGAKLPAFVVTKGHETSALVTQILVLERFFEVQLQKGCHAVRKPKPNPKEKPLEGHETSSKEKEGSSPHC